MQDQASATGKRSARDAHATQFANAPRRLIDIGHSRLSYRVIGSGPDVVFIHGWPLHSATFRDVAPRLARRFRCHLFDLPGAGESKSTAAAPIDLAAHPASARALIGQLGLGRYAIVAHDSGGYVARMLAADNPSVVGLVLGDTEIPGYHPPLIARLQRVVALPFGADLVRLALRSRAFRRSSQGFGSCFRDPDHIDGAFHDLFVAPILRSREYADAVLALLRHLDPALVDSLPSVHARIAGEVALVWGEDDRIFPTALAREMAKQFPRASFEVLPAGKTFVHEEQPEAFASACERLLDRAFAEAAQPAVAE